MSLADHLRRYRPAVGAAVAFVTDQAHGCWVRWADVERLLDGPGLTTELAALRQEIADEASRQQTAASAVRTHSDPDASSRANAHEFCAAVLESLLDVDLPAVDTSGEVTP